MMKFIVSSYFLLVFSVEFGNSEKLCDEISRVPLHSQDSCNSSQIQKTPCQNSKNQLGSCISGHCCPNYRNNFKTNKKCDENVKLDGKFEKSYCKHGFIYVVGSENEEFANGSLANSKSCDLNKDCGNGYCLNFENRSICMEKKFITKFDIAEEAEEATSNLWSTVVAGSVVGIAIAVFIGVVILIICMKIAKIFICIAVVVLLVVIGIVVGLYLTVFRF
ncbi:unnamed protein product [Caenorhabditis angaria]|uniref:Domain of unknown function DX domain-containing protein n=1 Tax=Caenorhabditis angaria TaxID=860376 RepID=A0A9P1IJZ7_9PELO|nr:unnamed protein product [Caenorhabditis angaria]